MKPIDQTIKVLRNDVEGTITRRNERERERELSQSESENHRSNYKSPKKRISKDLSSVEVKNK